MRNAREVIILYGVAVSKSIDILKGEWDTTKVKTVERMLKE